MVGRTGVNDADHHIGGSAGGAPHLRGAGAVVTGLAAVPHIPLLAKEWVVGDVRCHRRIDTPIRSDRDDIGARIQRRHDGRGFGKGHGLLKVDDPECRRDEAIGRHVGTGTHHRQLQRAVAHGGRHRADDESEHLGLTGPTPEHRGASRIRSRATPRLRRGHRRARDTDPEDERCAQGQDSSGAPHT